MLVDEREKHKCEILTIDQSVLLSNMDALHQPSCHTYHNAVRLT